MNYGDGWCVWNDSTWGYFGMEFSELCRLWWLHINRFSLVVWVEVISVKALNRVRGGFVRKVPVWRRGRWKSVC